MNITQALTIVDRLKRNLANTGQRFMDEPMVTINDLLSQGVSQIDEDFRADPVGTMVESSNFGGVGDDIVGGLLGITAYHGSPHTFNKFSLDRIGTGEGAQVYGHGLYFADNPEVAKKYAEDVSRYRGGNVEVQGAGQKVELPIWASDKLKNEGVESVVSEYRKRANSLRESAKNSPQPWLAESSAEELDSIATKLKFMQDVGGVENSAVGKLYKVDIPDEAVARMLQWDKPLSEQQSVLDQMQKYVELQTESAPMKNILLADQQTQLLNEWLKNPEERGDIFYSSFMDLAKTGDLAKNQKSASETLLKAGIPGIRYLDQGSRGTVGGTMNTVLFDDSLVKILERNGIPLGLLYD